MRYDDEDKVKPTPSKKNKKKWCGGHVGRKHEYEWVKDKFSLNSATNPIYVFQCKTCGRIDNHCFNWYKNKCICGKHNNRTD